MSMVQPEAGIDNGFSLLELMAALAIAGVVMAVSVPASVKLYQSMQYRDAVREVVTMFMSARVTAIKTGRAQSVEINPRKKQMRLNDIFRQLPETMNITVHSVRELNKGDTGIIRFYPEGGSSGGGVDIETPSGSGVSIKVDWLVGRVSQERYSNDG